MPRKRCHYCDRPAKLYCDFVFMGGLVAPITPFTIPILEAGGNVEVWCPRTCDRPLCSRHAARMGRIFWEGKSSPRNDTIDYCPEHAAFRPGRDTVPTPTPAA